MTKNEALVKMMDGVKMTHAYFQPEEYITLDPKTMNVIYEDGEAQSFKSFWRPRQNEGWQKNWREWYPVAETPEFPQFPGYTDYPVLDSPSDLYYQGYGTTWGTDLHGQRYWKLYDPMITRGNEYRHLYKGDIVNERARIEKIVIETILKLKKENTI